VPDQLPLHERDLFRRPVHAWVHSKRLSGGLYAVQLHPAEPELLL
jgi:hypothetical protein